MKTHAVRHAIRKEREFPKLMVNSGNKFAGGETVILATAAFKSPENGGMYLTGMVVHTTSKHYYPGFSAPRWAAKFFNDFDGVIQMENDE